MKRARTCSTTSKCSTARNANTSATECCHPPASRSSRKSNPRVSAKLGSIQTSAQLRQSAVRQGSGLGFSEAAGTIQPCQSKSEHQAGRRQRYRRHTDRISAAPPGPAIGSISALATCTSEIVQGLVSRRKSGRGRPTPRRSPLLRVRPQLRQRPLLRRGPILSHRPGRPTACLFEPSHALIQQFPESRLKTGRLNVACRIQC